MPRITLPLIAVVFILTLTLTPAAHAGIADSPLPVLLAGSPTLHLYSVPGVVNNGAFAWTPTFQQSGVLKSGAPTCH